MNSNRSRRIALTLGAAAGGLLAAAFLPMAVAAADEFAYEPDGSSFVQLPPSVVGEPIPISFPPFVVGETGTEDFNVVDATSGITHFDAMQGDVEVTQFLGVATETSFAESGWTFTVPGALDPGTQIDLLQLPGGFGSELIFSDLAGPLGLEDILYSPFGALTLF
jgi:hypothetical protein